MRICPGLAALACAGVLSAGQYSFRVYGDDDGLRHTMVRFVTTDADGFLWVATAPGVYRFDGTRFERIRPSSMPDDLSAMHSTGTGDMWFRAGDRLFRYMGGKAIEAQGRFSRGSPRSIGSSGSDLWMTNGKTLLRGSIPGNAGERIRLAPAYEHAEPLGSLLATPSGLVIFACGSGLCEWSHGAARKANVLNDSYEALAIDASGTIYARGRERLVRRSASSGAWDDLTSDLPPLSTPDSRPAVSVDSDGRALASSGGGFARLETGGWREITYSHGLPNDLIQEIFTGREGDIWLGAAGGGLMRWRGDGQWLNFTRADGLPREGIQAVAEDFGGTVWAGSRSGTWVGQQWEKQWAWRRERRLPPASAFLPRPDGTIWVGLQYGALRFHPVAGWTEPMDVTGSVYSFYVGQDGSSWVASSNGLFRSEASAPRRFERILPASGESPPAVYQVVEEGQGAFWALTSAGMYRIRGSRAELFTTADGLPELNFRAGVARQGAIWIAGLHPIGFWKITPAPDRPAIAPLLGEGAPSSGAFYSAAADRQGNVWAAGSPALVRFNGKNWQTFDRRDGLLGDTSRGLWVRWDGGVWIGTLSGLSLFTPPKRQPAVPLLPIVLTEFSQQGPDVRASFAVLSYLREGGPPVRYRLNGLSREWREATSREIRFAHLPAGDYGLEASAQGPGGEWTSPVTLTGFSVAPVWWESWWFRAAVVAALAAVGLLIWRARMRAAERKSLRRTQAMVDSYPGAVMVLDSGGRFLIVNHEFERLYDRRQESIAGRLPEEVLEPEEAARIRGAASRALGASGPEQWHEAVGDRIFDVTAFALRGRKGAPEAVCCFANDTTERETYRRLLEQSDQRYQAFVGNSTEGISRVEFTPPVPVDLPYEEFVKLCYERGVVAEANEAVLRMRGLQRREQFVGRPLAAVRDRANPEVAQADRRWFDSRFRQNDFRAL